MNRDEADYWKRTQKALREGGAYSTTRQYVNIVVDSTTIMRCVECGAIIPQPIIPDRLFTTGSSRESEPS